MARPGLFRRRTLLGRGSTGGGGGVVASNVSDQFYMWALDVQNAPVSMDAADLAYWLAEGVDGFVLQCRHPTIIGGTQTFTGDQGNTLVGAQWDLNRNIRVDVMPKFTTAGVGALMVIATKNIAATNSQKMFTGQTTANGTASDWTNVTIPAIVGMVQMCRAEGLKGLMFDNENYPANDGTLGDIWGSNNTSVEWDTRGYELGVAITTAWPDVCIASYYNVLSGSYDEYSHGYATRGYESATGSHLFWRGLSRGMAAAAPNGGWSLVFHEAIYYRGGCTVGARQMDHNGFPAVCARDWSHWKDVHDRIGLEAFIWIDRGVPGTQPSEQPYSPATFASQGINYRNWGVVLRGGGRRIWQSFEYHALDLPNRTLDVAPNVWDADYQPELVTMSTPAVIANNLPSLTISTPADGSTVGTTTVAVTGTASDDFGVSAVTWKNVDNGAVFVLTVGGAPSGGTYKLAIGLNGATPVLTGTIAPGASAATLDTAIEAVTGAGTVVVSGSGPYTVTFLPAVGDVTMNSDWTSQVLTGGTNPNVTVVESAIRNGHLTMDWVRSSGSAATSWVSHMNLSTAGAGGAIPLATGVNHLVFTARDTKGATTTVTRTVTRT